MFKSKTKDKKRMLLVRCISILLAIAVSFVNTPLAFTAFTVDSKVTFTASVTVPSGDDIDFDGIPDGYDLVPENPENVYNDNDRDGITDIEEYRMGTDPASSNNGMVASLIADPPSGLQPLNVTFIARVSGNIYPILRYEWDFDGNGTYDYWCYESEGNTATYKYTASGTFNPRLRVTDSMGNVAIGTTTSGVIAAKDSSSPTAATEFRFIGWREDGVPLPITLQLKGTGTAAGTGQIIRYQWDTAGNGEYDISSTKSADITKTYDETLTKSFYASLRVTDSAGLADIAAVGIKTNATEWNTTKRAYKPKIYFNNKIVYTMAGVPILLSGYGTPQGGNNFGYVRKLEWDFENDGIYDWANSLLDKERNTWTIADKPGQADVIHTYGAPGIYRAKLKVHTEANVTATDTILVIVSANGAPPKALATVSYNENNNIASIDGAIPLKATFDHSGGTGCIGDIIRYEWDFDGDKTIDYITTSPTDYPVYSYRYPGYYQAMLRVTDVNGLIDTFYIPVSVSYPSQYASQIRIPAEGSTVAGDAVTVLCDVFPDDNRVNTVVFQYRKSGDINWTNIGVGIPILSYTSAWDTTTLQDGARYELRAIVNGQSSDLFKITSVIVDNLITTPDIYERNNGIIYKKVVINPNNESFIPLPNGIRVEIPIGAIPDNQTKVVIITENATSSAGVGNAFDINMGGVKTLLKDITITMPYPDADNNGIVDGTEVDETTLVIKWFNTATGIWEPLYDSIVYPAENFVSAKVNHLSLFGIGPLVGGATTGLSSAYISSRRNVSYCFIATAVYGSPDAKEIVTLREFRDIYLMESKLGRRLISCYYRHSPVMAEFIKDKPVLKAIVRFLLKPLVEFAKISLHAKDGDIR